MISKIAAYIFDQYRIFMWILTGLCVICIYYIVSDLKVDNSLKVWYDENDKAYRTFIEFQDQYGNDDIITLMISYPHNVFEDKAIQDMLQLEEKFRSLTYVDKIYSYGSSDYLTISDSELIIQKVVDQIPGNQLERDQIMQRLNSFPLIRQTLISKDEKSHLILIRLSSFEDIELERDNIVRDLRSIIDQTLSSYQLGGMAVLNEALNRTVAKESAIFTVLNYLVLFILLLLFIKKRRYIYIVLPAIFVPVALTFGLFAATGQSLNMISITIPTILMVYALADVVHIINNYIRQAQENPELDKRTLVKRALTYSYKPCFYASATTMLAYISFYYSPLEVLKVTGLFAFVGLGIAFISVYLITIIGFAILKVPTAEKEWQLVNKVDAWIIRLSDWVVIITEKRKLAIISLFILLFIIGSIFIPQVEINTFPGEYLDKSSAVRIDSELIENKMGAYLPFEVIIKTKNEEKVISKDNLKLIEEIQNRISKETDIQTPTSIVEAVKYLNQQLSANASFVIPSSDQIISQLLLLYEMEENNRLRELTNPGYSEARITGKVMMLSANDYSNMYIKAREIFDDVVGPSGNLEFIPQGYMQLYINFTNYITTSLLYSFLGAFIMIGIVMFIFIRKFMLTLISLATNLIPISFVVLLLAGFNVLLDMGTVMIAAILLGIAVDDTMHLVHAYTVSRKEGFDKSSSIDIGVRSTMSALLASSIALTMGFMVLGLSSVSGLKNFGNLCAAAVAMTFVADILLLPSLIKLSELKNKFTKTHQVSSI